MKGAVVWGIVAVVILAVGGVLIYRSTAPNGDVVPEGESSLEEEGDDRTPDSQFLQIQPETGPPGGEGATSSPAAPGVPASGETPSPAGETATISMTDTGFVPSTLTVDAGTTVIFVNDGQALHWPASAVHPTHEILPEFDSQRGVATGETYAYTFTQPGTWNFHDHLNAEFVGTITVE
jgi:plastocyanin